MRLIDKDTLYKDICDSLNEMTAIGVAVDGEWLWAKLNDALDNAPVIEERKPGEWIERNPQNSDKCRLIECNKCGFSHIVGFNVPYEHWIENRNFCERCGADMRKGEGEKE